MFAFRCICSMPPFFAQDIFGSILFFCESRGDICSTVISLAVHGSETAQKLECVLPVIYV